MAGRNNEPLPIDRYLGDEYPEVLRTMAVELYVQLCAHDKLNPALTTDETAQIAFQAAESVRQAHSGFSYYIGKGVRYEIGIRDREIYNRFDGSNYEQLAVMYDLTEMRVRQIITACREADRRRRQGKLFGD